MLAASVRTSSPQQSRPGATTWPLNVNRLVVGDGAPGAPRAMAVGRCVHAGEEPARPAQPRDDDAGGDTAEHEDQQDERRLCVGPHLRGAVTVAGLRDEKDQKAKPLAEQSQIDQHRPAGKAAGEGRRGERAERDHVPPPHRLAPAGGDPQGQAGSRKRQQTDGAEPVTHWRPCRVPMRAARTAGCGPSVSWDRSCRSAAASQRFGAPVGQRDTRRPSRRRCPPQRGRRLRRQHAGTQSGFASGGP